MAQDMDSPAVERSEGTSVRESVVSAKGEVDGRYGTSPDVTSIVNGAVEHDRAVRHRERAKPVDYHQYEGEQADRRRSAIRSAFREESLKAVSGPSQPARPHETPTTGAPASWDLNAKAAWHEIPEPVRLAIQRDHSQFKTGYDNHVTPHLQRLSELDQVIAPSRAVFQHYGVKSDAEAVQRLFEWEASLRLDPHQGIQRLAQRLGVDLRQLTGQQQYDQPQQYQQQQQYTPQQVQDEHQHVARLAQGRPNFEQARVAMCLLLQTYPDRYAGADRWDKLYRDACRNLGISDSQRPARSPDKRSDRGVRSDLLASIKKLRSA